jgi:hypothetical protein
MHAGNISSLEGEQRQHVSPYRSTAPVSSVSRTIGESGHFLVRNLEGVGDHISTPISMIVDQNCHAFFK